MSFILLESDPSIASAPEVEQGETAQPLPIALFFGQGNGPNVLIADTGARDNEAKYRFRALSNPLAPEGFGGESIFTGLYLGIRHTMGVTIRLTPYVEGVAVPGCSYDIELTEAAVRQRVVHELGLFEELYDTVDTEAVVGRVYPRGTYFQLLVETLVDTGSGTLEPGLGEGELIFEALEVEHEPVEESRTAEAVA